MEKSLYKIESEYLDLINQLEESEGVLTMELSNALEINKNELEVKSIAYHETIKQRESLNERIDKEIARLNAIKRQNNTLILHLKYNLVKAVNIFGTFKSGFLTFSTRKSKQVEVNCDPNDLPKEFKVVKVTETPDKNAIKKAIEQGQEVTGCRIIENINLQIK